MSPLIAGYLLQALQLLPTLISTGQNLMAFINKTQANVNNMIAEKRDPTDQEWADLDKTVVDLRAQLHATK